MLHLEIKYGGTSSSFARRIVYVLNKLIADFVLELRDNSPLFVRHGVGWSEYVHNANRAGVLSVSS